MTKEKYQDLIKKSLTKANSNWRDVNEPANWPATREAVLTLIKECNELHEVYTLENTPKKQ